jgi:hypothetical protein
MIRAGEKREEKQEIGKRKDKEKATVLWKKKRTIAEIRKIIPTWSQEQTESWLHMYCVMCLPNSNVYTDLTAERFINLVEGFLRGVSSNWIFNMFISWDCESDSKLDVIEFCQGIANFLKVEEISRWKDQIHYKAIKEEDRKVEVTIQQIETRARLLGEAKKIAKEIKNVKDNTDTMHIELAEIMRQLVLFNSYNDLTIDECILLEQSYKNVFSKVEQNFLFHLLSFRSGIINDYSLPQSQEKYITDIDFFTNIFGLFTWLSDVDNTALAAMVRD